MKILIVLDLASISESAGSLWGPFHRDAGDKEDQIKDVNYNHVKNAVNMVLCYLRGEHMDIPVEIAFEVIDSRPEYFWKPSESEHVLEFREFNPELSQQLSEMIKNTKSELIQKRKQKSRKRVRCKKTILKKRKGKTSCKMKVRKSGVSKVDSSIASYASQKKNSTAVDNLCWVVRRILRRIAFDEEDTRSHIIIFSTIPKEGVTQSLSRESMSTSENTDAFAGKTPGEQERPVLEALMKVFKETFEKAVSIHWIQIPNSGIEHDPNHIKALSTRMKLTDSRSLGVIPIQSLLAGAQILPLGAFLGAITEYPSYRKDSIADLTKWRSRSDPLWLGEIIMAPPHEHKVICSVLLKPYISSSSNLQIFNVPSDGKMRIHAYVNRRKHAPVFKSALSFVCEPRGIRSFRFSQLMQILGKSERCFVLDITDHKGCNSHTAILTPISASLALVQIIFKEHHKRLVDSNFCLSREQSTVNFDNLECEVMNADHPLTDSNTLHLQPPLKKRESKAGEGEDANGFCPQSLDLWTGVWIDPVLDPVYEEMICPSVLAPWEVDFSNPGAEQADDSVSADEECEYSSTPFRSDNPPQRNSAKQQTERIMKRKHCFLKLVHSAALQRTIKESNCQEKRKKDLRLVGLVKAYNDQLRYLSGDPYQIMIVDSVRPVLKNGEVKKKELAKWLKINLLKRITDVVGNKPRQEQINVQLTKTGSEERFQKEKKLECQLQILLRMEMSSLITKNGKVVDPAKKSIRKEIKQFMGLFVVYSSNRQLRFFINDLKRWYTCLPKTLREFDDLVEDDQESHFQPHLAIDIPFIESRRPMEDTSIHLVNELSQINEIQPHNKASAKKQVLNNEFKPPRNISMIKRELNNSRRLRRNKVSQFNASILQLSMIHSDSSLNASRTEEQLNKKQVSFTNSQTQSILGKRPLIPRNITSNFTPGRVEIESSPMTNRTILGTQNSTIMATPDLKRRKRVRIPVNESPSVFLNVLIPPTPVTAQRQTSTPKTSPFCIRGLNFQCPNESGKARSSVSALSDFSGSSNDRSKEIPPSPDLLTLGESPTLSLRSRLRSPKRIVLSALENMSAGSMPRKMKQQTSINGEETTPSRKAEISLESIGDSDSEVSPVLH